MQSPKHRSIRDPLHGFAELSATEWAIVNHPGFQRLRDIRQLGMGHMVYPGANHTRFEHSIGVLHVSDLIFRRLYAECDDGMWRDCFGDGNESERLRRTLRLASLLHDVGHGPFSHSGEHLFIPASEPIENRPEQAVRDLKRRYNHETMTVRLLRETELADLVPACEVALEEVIHVATDRSHSSVKDFRIDLDLLNQLLTGELGSDRCDCLLRDAYHSGQPGGHFDMKRLVQQMTIIEKDDAPYLGIRKGGWIAAEQMIANRYAAYVNLYFHKAKRSYERHLVRFLAAWLPEGRLPQDPSHFCGLTDSAVIAGIKESAGSASSRGHEDAAVFDRRTHYRSVIERVAADRRPAGEEARSRPLSEDAIGAFANFVQDMFGSTAFVDILDHSATKIRRPDPLDKILVDYEGQPRYLEELSEIVSGMDDKIWRLRVHAHADKALEVKQFCGREWSNLRMKHGAKS